MKKRVAKKVERMALVDTVLQLQRQIDEYERYLGDLLIMILKGKEQVSLVHSGIWEGKLIWNKVKELIEENAELREKVNSA